MPKENNCQCSVCQVEHNLLNSLSTQTARTHFQAIASNYPVLNHFDSPTDVIARLHEHEHVEAQNHSAWNGILHALVDAIADRTAEEIGQQLLLVAYTPAIHKACREVSQRFPSLAPEDIAQQASVFFLENAKTPAMARQNGHLPIALVKYFRRRLFRWAIKETQRYVSIQDVSPYEAEPALEENFEDAVLLNHLLAKSQRMGILSPTEGELLRKFHCEGFRSDELQDGDNGPSSIALYYRIQRAVHRLRRISVGRTRHTTHVATIPPNVSEPKKIFRRVLDFSGDVSISKSEKGFSPELSQMCRGSNPTSCRLQPDVEGMSRETEIER